MALIESLKIILTADSSGLESGLQKAESRVNKMAENFGRLSTAATMAGGVLTGLGAIMVRNASQYDATINKAVGELSNAYNHLSVQIGQALLPVLETLETILSNMVTWLQQLSPEVKQLAGAIAGITAASLLFVAIGSKMLHIFLGLAPVLLRIVPMALMIAAGLMIIVTAIGAIKRMVEAGIFDPLIEQFRIVSRHIDNLLSKTKEMFENLESSGKIPTVDRLIKNIKTFAGTAHPKGMIRGIEDKEAGFGSGTISKIKDTAIGFGSEIVKSFTEGKDIIVNGIKGLLDKIKLPEFKPRGEEDAKPAIPEFKISDKLIRQPRAMLSQPAVTRGLSQTFGRQQVAISKGIDSFISALLDSLGNLGVVIRSIATGDFGTAVFAVVSESKTFQEVIQIVQAVFGALADAVGAILIPLKPLIAALMILVQAIATALAPAFALIASIIEPFIPIIVLVGKLFEAFAPAIGMIAAGFMILSQPLMFLATKALPPLFEVLKFAGLTILRMVRLVAPLWNGIINVITKILDFIGGLKIELFGAVIQPFAFLEDLSTEIKKAKIDISELDKTIKKLEETTFESAIAEAKAIADNILVRKEETKAIKDFTEKLTNVPAGFKVAVARYRAAQPLAGSATAGNTMFTPQGINVNVYLNGRDLAKEMNDGMSRLAVEAHGSPVP